MCRARDYECTRLPDGRIRSEKNPVAKIDVRLPEHLLITSTKPVGGLCLLNITSGRVCAIGAVAA